MSQDVIRPEVVKQYIQELGLNWRLGREMGAGGFSRVFELEGSDTVVKVIDTRCQSSADTNGDLNCQMRRAVYKNTLREIEAMKKLAQCQSPYIMQLLEDYEVVLDADEVGLPPEQRTLFRSVFLLRLPKLTELTQYLAQGHTVQDIIIPMLRDCLMALNDLHRLKILHRDVKPQNICVSSQGHFVLADFGISREVWELGPVTCIGSNHFIAPEIALEQDLKGRFNSDLYSLGRTAYALLGGLSAPTARPQGVPEGLWAILENATKQDPAQRYQTAYEMLQDVQRLDGCTHATACIVDVKAAILANDYVRAMRLANEAAQAGDQDCRRMQGYIAYLEWRRRPKENLALRDQARRILEELTLEGDCIAQALLGMLELDMLDDQRGVHDLKAAAEKGSVVAQYVYGRLLYEGKLVDYSDRSQGRTHIFHAAEQGYLPAMRIARRILARDSKEPGAKPMLWLMDQELEDYELRRKDNILAYL